MKALNRLHRCGGRVGIDPLFPLLGGFRPLIPDGARQAVTVIELVPTRATYTYI